MDRFLVQEARAEKGNCGDRSASRFATWASAVLTSRMPQRGVPTRGFVRFR
jgi:hypothetical protein